MKRKITLIIIILFTVATKAQSYFPLRNVETNLESFSGVNGQWISVNPASSTLGAYYYQGLNFGFDTNNYASLVNGVGTNELYFGRWSGGWKGWNKIWHSGNLNNTDTDFTAKTINITAGLDIKNSYNINATKALKMFYEGSWGTAQYASDYRFIDIQSTEEGKILALNAYGMGIGFNPPSYSSQDKLYINGNVGIGTISPSAKLHVNSTDVAAFFKSTTNSVPVSIINDGASVSTIGFKGSTSLNEYNVRVGADGNDFISYTNNVERMRINSNGNVGIGTPAPSFYQHGGNNKVLEVYNPNTTVNSQSHLILSTGSILPNSSLGSLTWAMPNMSASNKGLAYLGVITGTNSTSANPSSSMIFATRNATASNWNPNMVLTDTGNLGIGILSPTNKLDVNGTIHSKEVKVDMLGWSDFVFKKEYHLPTLEEVEKHIAEKGHLKNIPNEEEVLKNGINLGEMNAKLLQKIEELTLYVINQENKNNQQSLELEKSKNEIETLKNENKSIKNILERLSVIEEKLK